MKKFLIALVAIAAFVGAAKYKEEWMPVPEVSVQSPNLSAPPLMPPTPPAVRKVCADAQAVENRLRSKYGEDIVRRGLRNQKIIYEWWENAETGTFTVLTRDAHGEICIISSGTASHQPKAPAKGDPT